MIGLRKSSSSSSLSLTKRRIAVSFAVSVVMLFGCFNALTIRASFFFSSPNAASTVVLRETTTTTTTTTTKNATTTITDAATDATTTTTNATTAKHSVVVGADNDYDVDEEAISERPREEKDEDDEGAAPMTVAEAFAAFEEEEETKPQPSRDDDEADSSERQQQPQSSSSSSSPWMTSLIDNNDDGNRWVPSREWIESCVAEETPKAVEKGEWIDPPPFPYRRKKRRRRKRRRRRLEKSGKKRRLRRRRLKAKNSKKKRKATNTKEDEIIGDCVKHCTHCGHYVPESFNGMYVRVACPSEAPRDLDLARELGIDGGDSNFAFEYNGGNFELVEAIHRKQAVDHPDRFRVPDEDTLVIHLRLGDIVESLRTTSAVELLESGGTPSNHRGSRNPFENSLKSVYEILDNVRESGASRVHIRGGSHISYQYLKSRVYANCLHRAVGEYLEDRDDHDEDHDEDRDDGNGDDVSSPRASVIIEGSPSEVDFFFVSHARMIVVAPGGYSNLMGKLVERRGGVVIGRSFGLTWSGRNSPK